MILYNNNNNNLRLL